MSFPRYVYKKGTGRRLNDSGLYVAEGRIVSSQQELTALGDGWCATPAEAASPPAPGAPLPRR